MKCNWDITLVHYMATGSALHRIEARAKIIELMVFIITIFMDREINALAMMLLFSFWVMRQSKLPLRYVLRVIHGGQHAGAKHWGGRGASPWQQRAG